jgi:hypothetical protein
MNIFENRTIPAEGMVKIAIYTTYTTRLPSFMLFGDTG